MTASLSRRSTMPGFQLGCFYASLVMHGEGRQESGMTWNKGTRLLARHAPTTLRSSCSRRWTRIMNKPKMSESKWIQEQRKQRAFNGKAPQGKGNKVKLEYQFLSNTVCVCWSGSKDKLFSPPLRCSLGALEWGPDAPEGPQSNE